MPAHTHRPLAAMPRTWIALTIACAWIGSPAWAASFAQPVEVTLSAPGGLSENPTPVLLSENIAPGGTINAGNSVDIGSFMLPNESITLSDTSILVRIAQGASDGSTGYLGAGGQHASYTFGNLSVAGQKITGLSLSFGDNFTSAGFIGLSNLPDLTAASWIRLTTPTSVTMDIDTLRFKDRGRGESNNFADIRISLQLEPVPEPQTWALMLMGMAVLGVAARRRT